MYSTKLADNNQTILKTLEWCNKREIFQSYYSDMNAVLFYCAFNFKCYCCHTEFLEIFNI